MNDKEKFDTNYIKNISQREKEENNFSKPEISSTDEKRKSNPKMRKLPMSFLVLTILLSVFFGGIAGFLSSEISNKGLRGTVDQIADPLSSLDQSRTNNSGTNSKIVIIEDESAVVGVVEKTSPAVVSIIITKDVPKLDSFSTNPFFNDPFFNPFGFNVPEKNSEPETEMREIGGGTGFVVSTDGYIITNRHVVDDEDAKYTVVMNDGSRIEGKVLARDTLLDLAVLKIDKRNLPFVELGDSDVLKIGQTVVAIGNSLGEFRNTVSKGIISGLKRNVNAGDGFGQSELLSEVIQTDAAINLGNSGGPIINLKGQAVGVNVAMAQGAENIGFSIPINDVKRIYNSVRETGRIIRPFLGVRYMIINEDVKQRNELSVEHGALIVRGSSASELAVVPGSPANKVGLVEGDIILEVNGKKIDQENDLAQTIKKYEVGDIVTLKILSKGEEKFIEISLEAAD